MVPLLHSCGLYEILNVLDGTRYFGSSARLGRRINDHKYLLRRGLHHCVHLQRAWTRDGEAAFRFNILAVLEPHEQLASEQRLLDAAFTSGEPTYNMARAADSPMSGRKASPETKAKLSAIRKARFADPAVRDAMSRAVKASLAAPEVRAAMSARRTAENADPAMRERKAAKMRAYYADPANREKTAELGRGRVFSAETRAKIKAATLVAAGSQEGRAKRSATMKARWADPAAREKLLTSKGLL